MEQICYSISTELTMETGVTKPIFFLVCEKGKMPSIGQMTAMFKENGMEVVLHDLPNLVFTPTNSNTKKGLLSIKVTGSRIDYSWRPKVGTKEDG
jgi:hypothetical protein